MWLIPPESSKSAPEPAPSALGSPALFQALSRSATSNEKHIRPSAWSRLWKQETWIRRLSGWATSGPSRRTAGQDWWTRSRPASPVSPTASPVPVVALTTPDGSGPRLGDSYASYDPATSCWRTFQDSFLSLMGEPSADSLATWTRSGTTRSGAAYRRKPLAPPSEAIGSGSLRGGAKWPRPTSRSGNAQIAEEPTPGQTGGTTLAGAAERWGRLWAGNFNDSESPESWHARADQMKEKHHNGNGAGIPLAIQAKETTGRLWMRPRAGGRHAFRGGDRSQEPLLPGQAVETMKRLWMRPTSRDQKDRACLNANVPENGLLGRPAVRVAASLTGPQCPTTTPDGAPSSTPDLSSLRLSPLFDEWLLFGRRMIGWTCVCPARALARAVAGSPPSATPSVPTRQQPPCEPSGSAPSESGHE